MYACMLHHTLATSVSSNSVFFANEISTWFWSFLSKPWWLSQLICGQSTKKNLKQRSRMWGNKGKQKNYCQTTVQAHISGDRLQRAAFLRYLAIPNRLSCFIAPQIHLYSMHQMSVKKIQEDDDESQLRRISEVNGEKDEILKMRKSKMCKQ